MSQAIRLTHKISRTALAFRISGISGVETAQIFNLKQ